MLIVDHTDDTDSDTNSDNDVVTCSAYISASQVMTSSPNTSQLPRLLCSLGMIPTGAPLSPCARSAIPVVLDGRVLGEVDAEGAPELATKLRTLKALGQDKVNTCIVEPLQSQITWSQRIGQ